MSNVFQLFEQETVGDPSDDPRAVAKIAILSILASNSQLALGIEESSKHLDAVEHVFVSLGDEDTRNRLKHSVQMTREKLTKATRALRQQVKQLQALQRQLADAIAHTGAAANEA
jgi:hypothetical protein